MGEDSVALDFLPPNPQWIAEANLNRSGQQVSQHASIPECIVSILYCQLCHDRPLSFSKVLYLCHAINPQSCRDLCVQIRDDNEIRDPNAWVICSAVRTFRQ